MSQLPQVPAPVTPSTSDAVTYVPAAGERGWGKLILALIAFLLLPSVPQFRALVPIDHTMLLFVPAVAACSLVGWWAGGRTLLALACVLLAGVGFTQAPPKAGSFF